jgi:predicted nucleic acid-binding Zn ribbon protein
MSSVSLPEERLPHEAGRCVMCGHPVRGRRQACSAKCRVARWRRTREQEVVQLRVAVAQRQAEVDTLRQYIGELQHLVGRLKGRGMRR